MALAFTIATRANELGIVLASRRCCDVASAAMSTLAVVRALPMDARAGGVSFERHLQAWAFAEVARQ
jgi:hypothetical protein